MFIIFRIQSVRLLGKDGKCLIELGDAQSGLVMPRLGFSSCGWGAHASLLSTCPSPYAHRKDSFQVSFDKVYLQWSLVPSLSPRRLLNFLQKGWFSTQPLLHRRALQAGLGM